MNAQQYIENGAVLDYCLGLMEGDDKAAFEHALTLYPDLAMELKAVQEGLDKYALAYSKTPPVSTRDRIMGSLQNMLLEKNMDLGRLPLINRFSDHQAWLTAISPLLPKEKTGRFMHALTSTDTVTQVLVMSTTDIDGEVHDNVWESFIILEGECECHIGTDRVVRLKAGEYIEIPMHEYHDVKIISKYVVGIIQRIAA